LSDIFTSLPIPSASQFVGSSGQMKLRVTWAPINDEDPTQDGWLHYVDVVRWFVSP
jgi:hypothetical protein